MKLTILFFLVFHVLVSQAQFKINQNSSAIPKPTAMDPLFQQMSLKAKEKNLGLADRAYATPKHLAIGGYEGYIQKFEQGVVFSSRSGGIRVVSNAFFNYYSEGEYYNAKRLGFPVTDESRDGNNPLQVFELGVLYYNVSMNTFFCWDFQGHAYTTNNPVYPKKRGRFKVMVLGISCTNPTNDDILERDGPGDEIYVSATAFMMGRQGPVSEKITKTSVLYGAVTRPEMASQRIKAGTKSVNGGIKEGNSIPENTFYSLAEELTGTGRIKLPFTIWQGELIQDGDKAVIIPSVWEWDGDEDGFNYFLRFIGGSIVFETVSVSIGVTRDILHPEKNISNVRYLGNIIQTFNDAAGSNVRLGKGVAGDPKDRPVGMYNAGTEYGYRPVGIMIGYDDARMLSEANLLGVGHGIIKIDFNDVQALNGNYSLFLRIIMTD